MLLRDVREFTGNNFEGNKVVFCLAISQDCLLTGREEKKPTKRQRKHLKSLMLEFHSFLSRDCRLYPSSLYLGSQKGDAVPEIILGPL